MAGILSGIGNQFLDQLAQGDQVKDYTHASKTFVDSLYRLSPKLQNLFYVYFDLNPQIAILDPANPNSNHELGMLVKSAPLPKFTIQNKTLNAYNRKSIIQERINYDPLTITFHDDSADVVRNFWQNYFNYYYRDADHSEPLYNQVYKNVSRQEQNWGYTPKTMSSEPYINSITVYSMHQKTFSSYSLIRPTITNFVHGQHQHGEYEPMEHSMTIVYETVIYKSGTVSSTTMPGFGDLHYDKSPSPLTSLGGGTRSILGPGGLVEGASDVLTNIQNGNFGAAALGALRTGRNFKNADLKSVAAGELRTVGLNMLKGQSTTSPIFVPTLGSISTGVKKAVNSVPGLAKNTPYKGGILNMNSSGNQTPSSNSGLATGIAGGIF